MENLKASCIWTFKEDGIILARRKNLLTNYGLTNIANSWGGTSVAPLYLLIDNSKTTLSATYSSGVSSISTIARIDQAGDTQLVLSVGLINQETVTFSAVSGSGPYTYTLTGSTTNSHNSGEYVFRAVRVSDTLANVIGEIEIDHTDFPNQRLQSSSGFSSGTGNWTQQFYMSSPLAATYFGSIGLTDNNIVGQGNLHNYVVFGLDHTSSSNDLEIDVVLNITN